MESLTAQTASRFLTERKKKKKKPCQEETHRLSCTNVKMTAAQYKLEFPLNNQSSPRVMDGLNFSTL